MSRRDTVRNRIEQGVRGEIPETPKPADPLFARVRNTVVGGNRLALDAAACLLATARNRRLR